MRYKVLIITGIVLLLACAVLNIMYILDLARQDSRQELFQKVIVMKSKGHEKAELNDSIVWEVNR